MDALYQRHVQARDHLEIIGGILASVVANFGFRAPKQWATPAMFGLDPEKRRNAPKKDVSPETQIELLRGWYGTGQIIKPASELIEKEASDAE